MKKSAEGAKSTFECCTNADQALEGLDGHTAELGEWQAVASGSFLELLGGDFAGL